MKLENAKVPVSQEASDKKANQHMPKKRDSLCKRETLSWKP